MRSLDVKGSLQALGHELEPEARAVTCNCDQALALKEKARVLGLWVAYYRLRSSEPATCETGKHWRAPGDAHRAWRLKLRRVQALLGQRKAPHGHHPEFDSSGMLGLGEALPSDNAIAVIEQADGHEPHERHCDATQDKLSNP